jgi:hypothetical protein
MDYLGMPGAYNEFSGLKGDMYRKIIIVLVSMGFQELYNASALGII